MACVARHDAGRMDSKNRVDFHWLCHGGIHLFLSGDAGLAVWVGNEDEAQLCLGTIVGILR